MTDPIPELNAPSPADPNFGPMDAAIVEIVRVLKALGSKESILTVTENLLFAVVSGASSSAKEQDELLAVMLGRIASRLQSGRKPKLPTIPGRA